MRPFLRALAISALAGVSVLAPTTANAGTNDNVSTVSLKGSLVNASFASTDPSGCIDTEVFVTANDEIARQSTEPTSNGYAAVGVFQQNTCTGTTLLSAYGEKTPLPAGELVVSKQLDGATLSSTIPVVDDVSGASFPLTVDMTWLGTGDLYRNRSFSNDLYGGRCRVIDRWKGTGRDAQATGSVWDQTTNFTPEPSQSAEIGDVIVGSAVMHCP